jgi:hypothetical protein
VDSPTTRYYTLERDEFQVKFGTSPVMLQKMYFTTVSWASHFAPSNVCTHRKEQIRNFLFILSPSSAILPAAPFNIPDSTMYDHDHEEDEVEPWKRAPRNGRSQLHVSPI